MYQLICPNGDSILHTIRHDEDRFAEQPTESLCLSDSVAAASEMNHMRHPFISLMRHQLERPMATSRTAHENQDKQVTTNSAPGTCQICSPIELRLRRTAEQYTNIEYKKHEYSTAFICVSAPMPGLKKASSSGKTEESSLRLCHSAMKTCDFVPTPNSNSTLDHLSNYLLK